MNNGFNGGRRRVLIGAGATALGGVAGCHSLESDDLEPASSNELFIPPLIDSREHEGIIELAIQRGQHQFVAGIKSDTLGYNGHYLGPTIRLYRGRKTRLRFSNQLEQATSVHGHGLHVPGDVDGSSRQKIEAGAVWDVTLPIEQEASSNWYHPHLMGTTAKQVHGGLAGLYLIEDENSLSLALPNQYGVDDIPVILQDRSFNDGVMIPYPETAPQDLREDTLVVNGTLDPVMEVPAGLVRLRLLNAANGRAFEIYRQDGQPFQKIATEGGFLESPVSIDSIKMSPGERDEIVVDMSSTEELVLMVTFLAKKYNALTSLVESDHRMLRLRASPDKSKQASPLPKRLNSIVPLQQKDVLKTRVFELEGMEINGVRMRRDVINERVKLGELEQWTILSGRHPFHMHGASFQILSMNGEPPAPELRGWKDSINPRGRAELLIRFHHKASKEAPYMYHCHVLEHEDMGMMGQFTVA